jgi:hypothetical protein
MGLQRTLSGWLALLIRLVATAGLIYEIAIDQLKNPTALVVFGGLAGLPDVLGFRASVKQEVEREEPSK